MVLAATKLPLFYFFILLSSPLLLSPLLLSNTAVSVQICGSVTGRTPAVPLSSFRALTGTSHFERMVFAGARFPAAKEPKPKEEG